VSALCAKVAITQLNLCMAGTLVKSLDNCVCLEDPGVYFRPGV